MHIFIPMFIICFILEPILKLMRTTFLTKASLFCLPLLLSFLVSCTQTSAWKGKLIHGFSGEVMQYDFATKTDKSLFKKATQPFTAKNGEIFYVNDAFPKGKYLLRKYTAAKQFKDVLDMSSENPEYKQALEDYSLIRGTGISGVLSQMEDPKLSPNGKYLAITVYGYPGQAFPNNSVAVFDVATKKLVTQFAEKYHGSWTPDNRLVMTGSHVSGSSDGSEYHGKEKGIYITDAGLGNLQRIDPELDDPAPYHAAVSPDGKRIAFVMNRHVWVMNIDGSNLKQLTDVDRDNEETYPTWSPDGKYIACWCYKTFERSYFTAIAIVPANATKPVALTDKAPVWPKDTKGFRISGGSYQFSWR